jgi:hypothetical protein
VFEQGSARVRLHKSHVPSGYGSFPGTVPRIVVVCDGWLNPMELTRLNGPLAEFIPPRADPARFDAPQDGGFRHPGCLPGLGDSDNEAGAAPKDALMAVYRAPGWHPWQMTDCRHRFAALGKRQ